MVEYLNKICTEKGCKKNRLLENECKILEMAIKDYRMLNQNGLIKDNSKLSKDVKKQIRNKLSSIVSKYEKNKFRIKSLDCVVIENKIIKCYLSMMQA